MYWRILGALSPCERRQPFQPCLRAFPHCGAQSPTLSNPPAARRIAECANARRNVCALPKSPLPIRSRRWSRAHFNASPLRRLQSLRGSRSLRSRSPRHASRRAGEFPTVGHRGWSRSSREGTASGGMRVRGCIPSVMSASRRGENISIGNYCAVMGEEIPRCPATYCV